MPFVAMPSRRLLALGACALLGAALPAIATAQVVAHPNQIVGEFRFTNTNPDVIALIGPPGNLGPGDLTVTATSRTPSRLTAASVARGTALLKTYECTVESGTPGIAYDVRLSSTTFAATTVTSPPVEPEPAPDARADVGVCGGVLRVHFRWPNGDPAALESGSISTPGFSRYVPFGATEAMLLVVGSTYARTFTIKYQIGRDPMHDLFRMEERFTAVVPCDAITDVDLTCRRPIDCEPGQVPTGSGLGRIVGEIDVIGWDERPAFDTSSACTTGVKAGSGPFSNERWDCLERTPSSGAFELENLLPSDVVSPPSPYDITAHAWLDVPEWETLSLHPGPVAIGADELLDLGDLLVVDPATVERQLLLVGPPDLPGRGTSMLRNAERLRSLNVRLEGTDDAAPGARRPSAGVTAQVGPEDVHYDPATESVTARVGVVAGGYHGEAGLFELAQQTIAFWETTSPSAPLEYTNSLADLQDRLDAAMLLAPGGTADRVDHYCLGQVNVEFRSVGGTFYEPILRGSGDFAGQDFEGLPADYEVTRLRAEGTPRYPDAAATGMVRLIVPEGHYHLEPSVISINPGGGTTATELEPIDLDVRCRQVLKLSPRLQVALDPLPSCAADVIGVSGRVTSTMPVARVECTIEGGATVVLCSPCSGASFSGTMPLPSADAVLVVTATDTDGLTASASAATLFAREPSALDSRPGAAPLLLRRDGPAGLTLSWEDLAGAAGNVYAGTIASLHRGVYDHAAIGACGVTMAEASIAVPAADAYYLVGGSCAWGDGSLGRSSLGTERPPANPRCR